MAVAIGAWLALPAAAGAQPWRAREADTLGVAADAERLTYTLTDALGDCSVIGFYVIDDSASAERARRFPPCRGLSFTYYQGATLVGVPLSGDCHATFAVDAWRSESRREYRVVTTTYPGGCRAMRAGRYYWLVFEKLPPGWTVGFTRARADGPGEWTPHGVLFRGESAGGAPHPGRPR